MTMNLRLAKNLVVTILAVLISILLWETKTFHSALDYQMEIFHKDTMTQIQTKFKKSIIVF